MKKESEKTKVPVEFKDTKIEPIPAVDSSCLSDEDKEKYTKLGIEIIKNGKHAVVTMAGGQGTRLGHNGPKGTYDLGLPTHKSLFEILCDNLKETKKTNKYKPYKTTKIIAKTSQKSITILLL